jgi:hypothetical protein
MYSHVKLLVFELRIYQMASTSLNCSVSQGFNFEKDSQCVVGHLISLKIGTKKLACDIKVIDPAVINDDAKVSVVGVISGIFWKGGYTDPLSFNCRISTFNKQDIVVLQHSGLSDTSVEFDYVIYDYDPVAKVYYKAFHNHSATLKGLIEKSGGSLSLEIEMDQSIEVVLPENFGLYVGIIPQEEIQVVHFGVSNVGKFTKAWGVSVVA